MIKDIIKKSLSVTVLLLVLCGLIYPLSMTAFSQICFNKQANGSLITIDGKAVGSKLIGQNFTDSKFFRGRVSAENYNTYEAKDKIPNKDGKIAYEGVSSGSANLAPSNPALSERVQKDMNAFLEAHPGLKKEDIPEDLVTSSASGLDPDISPQSAEAQIDAVANATNISKEDLKKIVLSHTEKRQLGVFGEPRVNVLMVNLEIANLLKEKGRL